MPHIKVETLFKQTLDGEYDDDAPWAAVHELQRRGTREVFTLAKEWCGSPDPLRRARGLDVLAQLGKTMEHPSNSFPSESYSVVSAIVSNEHNVLPLRSAIAALGHLDNPLAVPLIAEFHTHPDHEVRFAVASALGSFPDAPLSVTTLVQLMKDDDSDVRDWATFGLGVLGNTDSSEIREEIFRALQDSNEDVREEALVGLTKRRDLRALAPLLGSLEGEQVSVRIIEAAYTLLGFESERKDWTNSDYAEALRQKFADEK